MFRRAHSVSAAAAPLNFQPAVKPLHVQDCHWASLHLAAAAAAAAAAAKHQADDERHHTMQIIRDDRWRKLQAPVFGFS